MTADDKQPVYDIESAVASGGSSTSDTAVDDSYEIYKKNQDLQYTEAEAKAVLRKIDFRIVPVLFVTYMLQYLDKVSSHASLLCVRSTDRLCRMASTTPVSMVSRPVPTSTAVNTHGSVPTSLSTMQLQPHANPAQAPFFTLVTLRRSIHPDISCNGMRDLDPFCNPTAYAY